MCSGVHPVLLESAQQFAELEDGGGREGEDLNCEEEGHRCRGPEG